MRRLILFLVFGGFISIQSYQYLERFIITGNKVLNNSPIRMPAGQHQIALNCMSLSKGIYLVKMLINDNVHFIKFLKE